MARQDGPHVLVSYSRRDREFAGEDLVLSTLLATESLKTAVTEEGIASWEDRMGLLSEPPLVEGAHLGALIAAEACRRAPPGP